MKNPVSCICFVDMLAVAHADEKALELKKVGLLFYALILIKILEANFSFTDVKLIGR